MQTQDKIPREVSDRLRYESRFKKLANAIHAASDFNEIMVGLRDQILAVYNVEMATIYLVDPSKKEIYSWVVLPGEVIKRIRIPISVKSIAGYVATTGRTVNLKDVYESLELMKIDADLKFDSSWDKKTGKLTKQVLAVPIRFKNAILGVIQLLNKNDGTDFTFEEEENTYDLAETLGIAFHNQYKLARKVPTKYDLLIREGILPEKEVNRAQLLARQQGRNIERVLLEEFKIGRAELGKSVANYYGVPYVDLNATTYDPASLLKGINLEYFKKNHCIPLAKKGGILVVAIDDPYEQYKIHELMQVLKATELELHLALQDDIDRFINNLQAAQKSAGRKATEKSMSDLLEEMKDVSPKALEAEEEIEDSEDKVVVLLVRKIIEDAHRQNASDIHIEPYGLLRDAEVRFRVDGRCFSVLSIPKNYIRQVVARFKILAQMDISDRRRPQDGKIKFKLSSGKDIEVRVSTVPTADSNEDVVLRILADREPLPLKKMMPGSVLKPFCEIIQKPYGIVLVVGPTGSGKTTTLHSALNFINTPDKKIWTVEDPVEITQYRLRQVQVNPRIDLNFAAAMRAFLRSDPDVIMVGEMRDTETVKMGIEASLTGHLVFSTLHTNSAPETVTRLVEMGMDPFNFADALLGILAQRLLRTLCAKCKQPYHPPRKEYEHLKEIYGPHFDERMSIPYGDDLRLFKATGCKDCKDTGYKGRIGVFELLLASEKIKRLIIQRASVEDIRNQAVDEGMSTLLQEGLRNIFLGLTDFNQVMSVCA